jgi:hypothetical protein
MGIYGQKRRGMVRQIGEGLGKRKPPCGGGSGCGLAKGPVHRLDGEGVFEPLRALIQVLNLPFLLCQQQVFNPIQSYIKTIQAGADRLDGLLGGRGLEALVDYTGQSGDGGHELSLDSIKVYGVPSPKDQIIEGGRCLCQAMMRLPNVPGVYDR